MKKIKVSMSEMSPVLIDPAIWKVIASAEWYNGEHESQANTLRLIKVRQKSSKKFLVYGYQEPGPGGQFIGTENPYAGYLVDSMESVIAAIRRVAQVLGDENLGNDCISDLPPIEI